MRKGNVTFNITKQENEHQIITFEKWAFSICEGVKYLYIIIDK